MIDSTRFLVDKGRHPAEWLAHHSRAVSATHVAKAATDSGFAEVVRTWGEHITPNAYMEFGTEFEPAIADFVKAEFGVMPCDWTIQSRENRLMVASPDGLSLDHMWTGEYKTTGKAWNVAGRGLTAIPVHYRRQVQWQLFCTGARQCVFAWLLREDLEDGCRPAWWQPESVVIERDEKEIKHLVGVAYELIEELKL